MKKPLTLALSPVGRLNEVEPTGLSEASRCENAFLHTQSASKHQKRIPDTSIK